MRIIVRLETTQQIFIHVDIRYYMLNIYWYLLTAGSAKKEMANTEKQEATILPVQVSGTVSPYPMVVTVICVDMVTMARYV